MKIQALHDRSIADALSLAFVFNRLRRGIDGRCLPPVDWQRPNGKRAVQRGRSAARYGIASQMCEVHHVHLFAIVAYRILRVKCFLIISSGIPGRMEAQGDAAPAAGGFAGRNTAVTIDA